MAFFFSVTWQTNFTTSERFFLRFPRYRHICLRAPDKCACNAIPALQAQTRYRHTFSVSQECACNEYLLYVVYSYKMAASTLLWAPTILVA